MIARNRATDFHRRAAEFVELPDNLGARARRPARRKPTPRSRRSARCPTPIAKRSMLRLVEGLTGPEIAERTGLTPASVRVNLHRGMKMLREKLDR